jgi:hypothetical protein
LKPQTTVLGVINATGEITQDHGYGKTLNYVSYYRGANPSDVTFDDVSLKTVTDLFAIVEANQANVTVKAEVTLANGYTLAGVMARADSLTNPQNFLMLCYVLPDAQVRLYKCVNGQLTSVNQASHAYAAGGMLELRVSGTDYEGWYRGAQKIAGTVDEATINDNTKHGLFSANGGTLVDSFFLLAPS